MTSQAPRHRLVKLGLLSLLCALPFFVACIYLGRQAERIDTLPVDEYADLRWGSDNQSLFFLHRSLASGAPSELWSQNSATKEFLSLGALPAGPHWRLTRRTVGDRLVLASSEGDTERLELLNPVKGEVPERLKVDKKWSLLKTEGDGLFFSTVKDDLAFQNMVEVEQAPEMTRPPSNSSDPESESRPDEPQAPTRSGLQIARFDPSAEEPTVLLSIPFSRTEEKPEVLLVSESPDQRFVAMVIKFGENGTPGLWVYDSDGSRLLWTRVVVNSEVQGLSWAPSSAALAMSDAEGLAVIDNVLGIESVRYQTKGLGRVRPLFAKEDSLYLKSVNSLYRLDRKEGQAEVVFDSRSKSVDAQSFVVNDEATKIAFFSSPQGFVELHTYSLNSSETGANVSDLPGSLRREAQEALTYQVGAALRTAWQYWRF